MHRLPLRLFMLSTVVFWATRPSLAAFKKAETQHNIGGKYRHQRNLPIDPVTKRLVIHLGQEPFEFSPQEIKVLAKDSKDQPDRILVSHTNKEGNQEHVVVRFEGSEAKALSPKVSSYQSVTDDRSIVKVDGAYRILNEQTGELVATRYKQLEATGYGTALAVREDDPLNKRILDVTTEETLLEGFKDYRIEHLSSPYSAPTKPLLFFSFGPATSGETFYRMYNFETRRQSENTFQTFKVLNAGHLEYVLGGTEKGVWLVGVGGENDGKTMVGPLPAVALTNESAGGDRWSFGTAIGFLRDGRVRRIDNYGKLWVPRADAEFHVGNKTIKVVAIGGTLYPVDASKFIDRYPTQRATPELLRDISGLNGMVAPIGTY